MTLYKFSERAYAKMIFHAAKYPHLAVNGVLLSSKTEGEIVDAIPLFHQCLYVTPMVEIALMQVRTIFIDSATSLEIHSNYNFPVVNELD